MRKYTQVQSHMSQSHTMSSCHKVLNNQNHTMEISTKAELLSKRQWERARALRDISKEFFPRARARDQKPALLFQPCLVCHGCLNGLARQPRQILPGGFWHLAAVLRPLSVYVSCWLLHKVTKFRLFICVLFKFCASIYTFLDRNWHFWGKKRVF